MSIAISQFIRTPLQSSGNHGDSILFVNKFMCLVHQFTNFIYTIQGILTSMYSNVITTTIKIEHFCSPKSNLIICVCRSVVSDSLRPHRL